MTVRSVAAERRGLEKVPNLSVFVHGGITVRLAQVADILQVWGNSAILRRDRYRTVSIEAAITDDFTEIAVFEVVRPWVEFLQITFFGAGFSMGAADGSNRA